MKHFKFRFPTYDNNSHASSASTEDRIREYSLSADDWFGHQCKAFLTVLPQNRIVRYGSLIS